MQFKWFSLTQQISYETYVTEFTFYFKKNQNVFNPSIAGGVQRPHIFTAL